MNSYKCTVNSEPHAAAYYNNLRGQIMALGGHVSFDKTFVFMNLPTGHLPTDFIPGVSYVTLTAPPRIAALASDPNPHQAPSRADEVNRSDWY